MSFQHTYITKICTTNTPFWTPTEVQESLSQKYSCESYKLQVQPKGLSGKSGLQNGDLILRIGDADMQNATHEQARNEMIRSGNEVDLVVQRYDEELIKGVCVRVCVCVCVCVCV
jgi:S1-C subfamily serine protease